MHRLGRRPRTSTPTPRAPHLQPRALRVRPLPRDHAGRRRQGAALQLVGRAPRISMEPLVFSHQGAHLPGARARALAS
jgi:hypothetical protein